jgi:hypothetical protein
MPFWLLIMTWGEAPLVGVVVTEPRKLESDLLKQQKP